MKDFATGKPINLNRPEEKVRQEFERILVNDYGYSKDDLDIEVLIQIGSKSYPCDIAVYENKKIVGIVETKKKGTKEGQKQLVSYMSPTSTCRWGVWTNGDEELCAIKKENGEVYFDAALRIPHCGVGYPRIEQYDDLIPATNLKRTFKIINNALYANTDLARTEKQGAEMVRLLFCKLTDEYNIRQNGKQSPAFQIYQDEHQRTRSNEKKLRQRINQLWDKTKSGWVGSSIFMENERIEIDDYALRLIVSKLQSYSLLKTQKDIVGAAFEVFSEKQFAGEKGQFFTPRSVVDMIVKMIEPTKEDLIIDPACGSGGFLIAALDYITKGITDEGERKRIAEHCLFGIDKESDLAKICKAHMTILGDGRSNIVKQNSLKPLDDWEDEARGKITEGGELRQFDICITNPPFGANIKVSQPDVLERFQLGHTWKKKDGVWTQTSETKETPPQILFLELCLRFLVKPGGKIGIVLPDGLLGNPTDGHIRYFIQKHSKILAVVDCPIQTFMPHTGTKTSILILQKNLLTSTTSRETKEPAYAKRTFFAIAEHCGHTMRGYDSDRDDFSFIADNFNSSNLEGEHLGFLATYEDVLVPRYYDPRIIRDIERLEQGSTMNMPTVSELIQERIISVKNMPSSATGKDYDIHGEIRFIRTSDISGYELHGRTQKNVDIATYELYKEKQDLRKEDILFVKDGDTKIGETAILLDEDDLKVLVQTHFKKIRALKINPFLLLWMINKDIVKRQIRQRVFSQSTLSTIGNRIGELRLPLPDKEKREHIAEEMQKLVTTRRESLKLLQQKSR